MTLKVCPKPPAAGKFWQSYEKQQLQTAMNKSPLFLGFWGSLATAKSAVKKRQTKLQCTKLAAHKADLANLLNTAGEVDSC